MDLGQLKQHIKSFPGGTVFKYSLSDPFSWRGIYAEVAFSLAESPSTKEDLLKKIDQALTEEFYGYKGGEYYYSEDTPVHFEESGSDWTDGGYTEEWISKLLGQEPVQSPEHRLINMAFAH